MIAIKHESVWRVAAVATCLWLGLSAPGARAADPEVRVGVLKFGTVQWELDVIKRHQFDRQAGVSLTVTELTGKDPTSVALQAGSVDLIVNDFVWVSRQRADGADFTFVPHSLTVGALMVRPDSGITSVADLKGKKLGVAGGPVDKSWLLLRAYAKKQMGIDLAAVVDPAFAASPLLNELTLKGDLPATLNFWNFNARLKAAGMKEVITVADMLPALGVTEKTPLIGWVFSEAWARKNPDAIRGFLKASRAAKDMLAADDAEWERLKPLIRAEDETTFKYTREAYRAGIAPPTTAGHVAAAEKLFGILAEVGGNELVGRSRALSPGTFAAGFGT